MQRKILGLVLATGMLHAGTASALAFDQNVTPDVIFGSGNTNGSFTTDTGGGVEVGLRAKLRHNAAGLPENTFNSNGDGSYSFAAGVAPTQPYPTGVWSFEWSINSNVDGSGVDLGGLFYELGFDSDPGAGQTWTSFDPINDINPGNGQVWWDHSMGDNTTGNGGGASAGSAAAYATALTTENVAQNSWKAWWFLPGFNPNASGTYDFYLQASTTLGGPAIARTEMSVRVPSPATPLLLALGLLSLGTIRRRSGVKTAA
jgi:hypothetical protein